MIFSSDNGPENTGPASRRNTDDESTGPGFGSFASVGTTGGHRGRKRSLLQGGIGVPFIAKLPGRIAQGKIDDTTPITAVDLLPTFCAIAGAKLPNAYTPDGVDQSAALFGKPSSIRSKPIFWQWNSASRGGANWPTLAVRQSQWKLLLGKDPLQVELFRFPQDRLEKTNLQTAQVVEVKRLRALVDGWTKTLPDEALVDVDRTPKSCPQWSRSVAMTIQTSLSSRKPCDNRSTEVIAVTIAIGSGMPRNDRIGVSSSEKPRGGWFTVGGIVFPSVGFPLPRLHRLLTIR